MLRKLLRTAQTYLPALSEFKYWLQLNKRQILRQPFDRNFEVLRHLSVPSGKCIIDIGANRGQSIHAIRLFQPEVPIHAFEPHPTTFNALKRYTSSIANLSLHNCGLGLENGAFLIYTPSYNGYVFDGLTSIKRDEAANWLNPRRIYGFSKAKLKILEQEVTLSRLDAFELSPAFIKIDVQGAEREVLKGGIETLREHKPILMLEDPEHDDLSDILRPLGYVRHVYVDGRLIPSEAKRSNVFHLHEANVAELLSPDVRRS